VARRSAASFPEIIEKAFALAESGRPGPVLVDVPMDIFSKEVSVALFDRLRLNAKSLRKPSLDDETAAEIVKKLMSAKHPVLYVGGGIMLADATAELRQFGRPSADSRRAYADGEGRTSGRSSRSCSA
jgi:acetolactate synthase-1/2/3 large subunit